jgi:hypothetical protein
MQQNEHAESAALESAEQWLRLIDENEIGESWKQAALMFRNAVTVEEWESSVAAAQKFIGKPLSRKLKSKRYVEELPGAPDGEYVVIEYETSFQNKKSGSETVTPMKDPDGQWRVVGYFVK